tara:strand:- start:1046 stop:1876 length:831 start_codon:yes stop_codon:yes gene_type:complete
VVKKFTLFIFIGLAWGKTTIAVFEFENNGLEPYEVRQLSTRLESELVKIGKYDVVERSKIDEILKEQKLQMSGCVEECLIDVGKMLGAKQIIIGSAGKLGSIYTITAKLVDATSGKMLRTSDFDTNDGIGSLAINGMKQIALELAEAKAEEKAKRGLAKELDLESMEEKYTSSKEPKKRPEIVFIPYDDPPVAKSPIRPEYPEIAQQAGIEGVVVVQAFIDEKGRVQETYILKGVPNTGFDEAAMKAILATRFRPAKAAKKPIGVWVSIPVNFRLK